MELVKRDALHERHSRPLAQLTYEEVVEIHPAADETDGLVHLHLVVGLQGDVHPDAVGRDERDSPAVGLAIGA